MSNYKEFKDVNNGISFEYPSDWVFQTEGSVGVTIFGRKETLDNIHERQFDPLFNVISTKLSSKTSESSFINAQIEQMKYMAPGTTPKIEDVIISGISAKKVISRIKQDNFSMTFFALLATFNGTGYAMFFHCSTSQYKGHVDILGHIVATLKFSKFADKLITLLPYVVESANLVIRYPKGYEVIKKVGDDNTKPEVTFVSKEKNENGELKSEIKVVIQQRTGTLDQHVDLMKDNLERMLIDEVSVSKLNLGTKSSISLAWNSDAKIKNGHYMHLLTSENDEAPIVAVSFVSNFVETESRISDIFKAVRNCVRFTTDSDFDTKSLKWNTHISLDHKVGMNYNPDHFVFENVPLTEGSFIMKEDAKVDNPRCNFALMVKSLDSSSDSKSLNDIENELIRNISELCDNQVKIIQNKSMTVLGYDGKIIIFKGEAFNPVHNTKESLIFVYKFFITEEKKSVMFAFSSAPDIWEREWEKASLYTGTDRKSVV